jgi:hypothetical protein
VYPQDRFGMITATSPAAPVAMDTANGNIAANDGYTWVEMTLSGGVARTVTFDIPAGVDVNLVSPDRSFPLPSNGVYYTGVFPVHTYPELLITVSGSGVALRLFSLRGGV